jgi:hypothetical protein
MGFFFSLIPATVCVVVGYFVLFSATMTRGPVQIFGYILAAWLFIIAASFPTMGAYANFSGLCPAQAMIQSMHPKP